VLEPTAGYLALALHLARDRKKGRAYNFGPSPRDQKTVSALVRQILKNWPGRWRRIREKNPPHEAGRLQLNNQHALREIRWRPRLSFAQSITMTMDWYRASIRPNFDAFQACRQQIKEYSNLNPR
jgi:CDP-glucose 4,6-dehydratase